MVVAGLVGVVCALLECDADPELSLPSWSVTSIQGEAEPCTNRAHTKEGGLDAARLTKRY